jgi:hypothetical protein
LEGTRKQIGKHKDENIDPKKNKDLNQQRIWMCKI